MTTPAPTADASSGRPQLERRAAASVQVLVGAPDLEGIDAEPDAVPAEAQRGSNASSVADTNSGRLSADDGDDTDPEGCSADENGDDDPEAEDDPESQGDDDPEVHDGDVTEGHDDDDPEVADEDGCEPQMSARERRLAWLAEEWGGENLPAPTARTGGGGSVARIVLPEEPLKFVRPDAVRGIYLNAWAAGSSVRSQALIDLATRTEVNTLVIDLKDASGYVSHATEVMMAREVGADQEIRIRDLVGLLERIQDAGLYPIARIVMVKDPLLIRARPEWAVQDTAGGTWVDSNGLIWANLHDQRVWDYHVDLAKEAAAIGFPEIQWDYVRFADAP
ncbi:MAG: putative glycoside hydrolase, partial [Longimicrobiales bacterium]